MTAFGKLFAGMLAASGLSVAIAADDPISLDGMGSMMSDIGHQHAVPTAAIADAPVAAPAPAATVAKESCPNSRATSASLRISAASMRLAMAHRDHEKTLDRLADVQAQAAARVEYARLVTANSRDMALRAVHSARLNLKASAARMEPAVAQHVEMALARAETGLSRREP